MPPQIPTARPLAGRRPAARGGRGSSGPSGFKPPRPQAQNVRKAVPDETTSDVDELEVDTDVEVVPERAMTSAADTSSSSRGRGNEEGDEDGSPALPPELLTRLLHHFFSRDGTRITQDANTAVNKYMEIFVREAIARAVAERRDVGGFLDVDVLQKVAGQLVMDM